MYKIILLLYTIITYNLFIQVIYVFIFYKGEMLLAKKHKSSREIRSQLEYLVGAWRNLMQESNNRGRGLEEAQDILEFNNQVEKIEAWIRDKVCFNSIHYFILVIWKNIF